MCDKEQLEDLEKRYVNLSNLIEAYKKNLLSAASELEHFLRGSSCENSYQGGEVPKASVDEILEQIKNTERRIRDYKPKIPYAT